jgi:hypothetical protein
VVEGLIWGQVKDGPSNYTRTLQVYGDGPSRHLQGASRREEVLLAQLRVVAPYYSGKPGKEFKGRTLYVHIVRRRMRTRSTS